MTLHSATLIAAAALLAVAGFSAPAASETAAASSAQAFNAPEGFVPPPLHPEGATLHTRELAPGVYALISDKPPVDNSGFVVGENGVLVIDAHINAAMARQIQAAVRAVTDKPILYLVNTNFHGDHTFGNYAFPARTRIIAHRATARLMRDFEGNKRFMMATVDGDPSVFAEVRLRLPDQVFENYLRLDLGGRVVELHHFGPGNTLGDTVVYVPAAKVAWTGNLVIGAGTIPPLFEGGIERYIETIARFAVRLDARVIIPGHAAPAGNAILGRYLAYLSDLLGAVRVASGSGKSLEETLADLPLPEAYVPAAGSPAAPLRPFLVGLHRLNVQQTYLERNGN